MAASRDQVSEVEEIGEIIAQSPVPVERGDTIESLAARVLVAEHALYPRVLMELCKRGTGGEAPP